MEDKKLYIGRIVYLKPINNNARKGNKKIEECKIEKIGRKYFEVDYRSLRFTIDNLEHATEYSKDWKLHLSEQDILDEYEKNDLNNQIENVFRYGSKLSLDKLRRIKMIIDEKGD